MENHSIFGEHSYDTPVEEFDDQVKQKLGVLLKKLRKIWDDIGLTNSEKMEKMAKFEKTMTLVYHSEEKAFTKRIEKLNKSANEVLELSKELGTSIDLNSEPTVIENETRISQIHETLQKQVNERKTELKSLQDREQELCERLNEDPLPCEHRTVPSLGEIGHLRTRINTLQQELVHRQRQFSELKGSIQRHTAELREPLSHSFVAGVISGSEELVTLSSHCLAEMRALNTTLLTRVKENAAREASLKDSIETLWSLLDVSPEERREVTDAASSCVPDNIRLYSAALARLEEQKMANLSALVGRLRQEVEAMWGRCYVGELERDACAEWGSGEVSSEVMAALEATLADLRTRHAEGAELYGRLDAWHQAFQRFREHELRSLDPSRLFNRGGALLAEQREFKKVQLELKRLGSQLEEYGDAHGARVAGAGVREYLAGQWDAYQRGKEQEARAKQEARQQLLEREARLGAKPAAARRNTTLRRNASASRGVLTEHNPPSAPSRTPRASRANPAEMSSVIPSYSQFSDQLAEFNKNHHQAFSSVLHSPGKSSHASPAPLRLPRTPTAPRRPLAPPSTLPRTLKGPTPRARLAPPTTHRRASPRTAAKQRTPQGLNSTRNRTNMTQRSYTAAPGRLNTSRSTSSLARHKALYKTSPVMRRGTDANNPTVISSGGGKRRSVRLTVAQNGQGALSTPARNRLHFVV